MTRDAINRKLLTLGIDPDVMNAYDEPHRYYHNITHIQTLIQKAIDRRVLTDDLFVAICFHDIVYDPRRTDNEYRSSTKIRELVLTIDTDLNLPDIVDAIITTKDHIPNRNNRISIDLCKLDLDVIYSEIEEFIEYENKIFKEYQYVSYHNYRKARLKFLVDNNAPVESILYVKHREIKIGVYCGTFNPFTIGHLNILLKAEQIFDKVIIARGINATKNTDLVELPASIQNRQIETYDYLTSEFISEQLELHGGHVTLIRGLRNHTDFEDEKVTQRFLTEFDPNIKIVHIICDAQYEHISSSAVRSLNQFGVSARYIVD